MKLTHFAQDDKFVGVVPSMEIGGGFYPCLRIETWGTQGLEVDVHADGFDQHGASVLVVAGVGDVLGV